MTQGSLAVLGSARPPSERVRLARVALAGALAVSDVVRGEAGVGVARVVTADGPELLRGVSAVAQSDGRYAIDLRLIARLVPLEALADRVRFAVREAAARAGLRESLGSVDVEFVDVLTDEEIAQSLAATETTAAATAPPDSLPPSVSPSPQPPTAIRQGLPQLPPEGLE